jgi:hypothetical protein
MSRRSQDGPSTAPVSVKIRLTAILNAAQASPHEAREQILSFGSKDLVHGILPG